MKKLTISTAVPILSPDNLFRQIWRQELVRYLMISALAFVLDFSTLMILTKFINVPYLFSAIAGFMLGLSFVYTASIYWIFSERAIKNAKLEFLLFMVIGVFGLLINELVLWLGVAVAGTTLELAKLFSAGLVFASNFILRKYLLFTLVR